MEQLHHIIKQLTHRVWLGALIFQGIVAAGIFTAWRLQLATAGGLLFGGGVGIVIASYLTARLAAKYATQPLHAVETAILHVSPSEHNMPAPELEHLTIGRAYVTDMVKQIHEIASVPDNQARAEHHARATQASNILSHLPLPVFVFNKDQQVTFASDVALAYIGIESAEFFGKPLLDAINLEFSSDFTLTSWITDCQANKATDTAYWQRVRIASKANPEARKQCDIAGSYSRNNSQGVEFVVTLFDRTEEYNEDDQSINFIALAVHELRTPLTVMRGYIEAFREDLTGKLDDNTAQYVDRLHASVKQFSAFVNNILNVARIQENQLTVKLAEEQWADIVARACEDMELQAKTRGKTIIQQIQPDLPSVGADRTTTYEVLCNLIDNAIKYSGESTEITVSARLTNDGLVETSVQDKGVGIPSSVLPALFERFHRNHRNRSQISGTGLGLYISKAIIEAHDGSIWVNSREGEGSTLSFTLHPYASLAANQKTGDNSVMTRTAHGWIKNHSMYRK